MIRPTVQEVPSNPARLPAMSSTHATLAVDAWVRKPRVFYWLDLGNGASSGRFVLGQPNNAANRKKRDRLPTVAELYPEILAHDDKQPAMTARQVRSATLVSAPSQTGEQ